MVFVSDLDLKRWIRVWIHHGSAPNMTRLHPLEHVHENVDDQEVAIASSEDDTRLERDLQDTLAQWMWNDH